MKKFQLSLLAIPIAIFISGCNSKTEQAGAQQRQMPPQSVTYQTVKVGPVEIKSSLKGRLVASDEAEVRPQITGIIRQFDAKDGQNVKKGDVLYTIDQSQYLAAVKQSKASLKSIEADIKSAKSKAERYAQLAKDKAIPQQDADDATALYNKLLANLDERKAALEIAELNLEYTKIKSPISGTLGIASITTGALVTANQSNKINTVTQLDPIYVDITQQSSDFLNMKNLSSQFNSTEIPVVMTIGGGNNSINTPQFKGFLISQEAIVDPQTDSVKIRAKFENPKKELLPGMFANTDVIYAVQPDGIKIPMQSIIIDNDGSTFVYLLNDDKTVKKQTVKILHNTTNEAIISEGLKKDDKVIFQGISKIRDGATVAPIEQK